jgi:hypothetical protein
MSFVRGRLGAVAVSLVCVLALASCGGGGSTGGSAGVPAPTPTPSSTTVVDGSATPILLDENPGAIVGDTSAFGTIVGAPGTVTIDGQTCPAGATINTHYHVHLSLFVNGHQDAIPAGTGIYLPTVAYAPYFVEPGSNGCTYPLHVHALMGMVHIESAQFNVVLTLGEFLDIWGQQLATTGFGPFTGATRWFDTDETGGNAGSHPVTELTGTDPHAINLVDHHEYTIEVGPTYVSIPNFTWSSSYP